MKEYIPDYYFLRITDISLPFLKNHNIKAVGIDLDNTTVYDCTLTLLQGAMDWIKKVSDSGIQVIIITNTFTLRAKTLAKKMNLPYLALSKKPRPENILKALDILNVSKEEFMMIGDILFKDVAAANNAGVISVKVDPFMKEIVFKRKYERLREKEQLFKENAGEQFPKMKGPYHEY